MIIERYPNELPGITYNMVVIKPTLTGPGTKFPLCICLVGLGAARMDNIAALEADIPANVKAAADSDGFIIVAVQTPDQYNDEILFAFKWAFANLPVSPDTGVYGYGFSYGGAIWNFVTASLEQAKMFDAIVPVATVWTTIGSWKHITDANLQVWAFHNKFDTNPGTPVAATNNYVDAVNSLKPGNATKTIFNANGHGGWNEAASTTTPPYAPGGEGLTNPTLTIWKWFKLNTRTNRVAPPGGASGLTPILNISEVNGRVQLDGRASSGYKSATLACISVPDGENKYAYNINGGGTEVGWIQLSKAGTYIFRLTIYSGGGYTGTIAMKDVTFNYGGGPVPKTPASFDQVANTLLFTDGSSEPVVSAITDLVSKRTTFKTAAATYIV